MNDYSNFFIPVENKKMEELCKFGKFTLQKHQQFIGKWFEDGNSKILLFHGLGSGKTCSSIVVAQALLNAKKVKKVHVVTPASLVNNYKKELTGSCGGYSKIPSSVDVYSYEKFTKTMEQNMKQLDDSLVVIDEVQNIVSITGTTYRRIFDLLVTKQPKNLHVVLLSGTPIFDKAHEIALTLNLLDLPNPLPIGSFYNEYLDSDLNIKNQDDFMKRIYPYVSAFSGISPNAYAKRTDVVLLCRFNKRQLRGYENATKTLQLDDEENFKEFSQHFLIGPRVASNMIYYDGSFAKKGKENLLKKDQKKFESMFKEKNLELFSTKFFQCLKNIRKADGPVFVYSNFVYSGGIDDFELVLKMNGFDEYTVRNSKKPKYGIFRTGADNENKLLVDTFNDIVNMKGKNIKVIIGSPAMKEGISLKNTREVHLLDPYWNNSRTNQIVGRAIRFCSHVQLAPSARHVQVYHYVTHGLPTKQRTVDQHVMKMALNKQQLIDQFENLLYKASADCHIFHNVNGLKSEDCYKGTKVASKIRPTFTFKLSKNSKVSENNSNTENALYNVLKSQGVNASKKVELNKQPVELIATLHSSKNYGNRPQFGFRKYPYLTNLIGDIIDKKHKNNINTFKIKINPRSKQQRSSIPDNTSERLTKRLIFTPKNGKGSKSVGRDGKTVSSGCPETRIPINGRCMNSKYPFIKTSKSGKLCCFTRPSKNRKGLVIGGDKVYMNGVLVSSMRKPDIIQFMKNKKVYNNKTDLRLTKGVLVSRIIDRLK